MSLPPSTAPVRPRASIYGRAGGAMLSLKTVDGWPVAVSVDLTGGTITFDLSGLPAGARTLSVGAGGVLDLASLFEIVQGRGAFRSL